MSMGEFFHEDTNCHDTYVNLVNDELATLKIDSLETFDSIIIALQAFCNDGPCQHQELNDLLKLADPEYGYVYPEHFTSFIEKILKQRIQSFINDFKDTESRLQYLQSLASKPALTTNPTLNVERKPKSEIIGEKYEKYEIHHHTLMPEYYLIIKIVDTMDLILKNQPHETKLHEIYDILGLPNHTMIPEDTEPTTIECTVKVLLNLKRLLDASTFTIEQFQSFDKDMRWHLTMYPNTILGDEDNIGINVLTADEDILHFFIKCKQFMQDLTLGKKRRSEIEILFEEIGGVAP